MKHEFCDYEAQVIVRNLDDYEALLGILAKNPTLELSHMISLPDEVGAWFIKRRSAEPDLPC